MRIAVVIASFVLLAVHGLAAEADREALERVLNANPVPVDGQSNRLARLKANRYNAALREFQSRHALWQGGKETLGGIISSAQRLCNAELDCNADADVITKTIRKHLEAARWVEEVLEQQYRTGVVTMADADLARWWRLELEIRHFGHTDNTPATDSREPPSEMAATIRSLLEKRRDVLLKLVELVTAEAEVGRTTQADVFDAKNALLEAEVDLAETAAQRLAIKEQLVENMKRLEEVAALEARRPSGDGRKALIVMAARLEFEARLLKETSTSK